MMLDDAAEQLSDFHRHKLNRTEEEDNAVKAPDGKYNRTRKGEVQKSHQLREHNAQHRPHRTAPQESDVPKVLIEESTYMTIDFSR